MMAGGDSQAGNAEGRAGGGEDVLARATLAFDEARPQDAEAIAAEVLKADPHHVGALYVLGCALTLQGRAEAAIAPLEAAARDHDDPALETALAVALRQAGRHADAVSRLERATGRHPHDAAALLELGYLLVLMGRHAEAADVLGRGVEIAPTRPQMAIQLGYAQLSRGDCAGAKAAFARALDLSPSSPDALFGLAKAHQEIGENAVAAAYFRRYLKGRPDDAGALLGLGHCLLELGEAEAGYDCSTGGARRRTTLR
jgi:tetratricopeptide (TPR) repeat protein